MKEIDPHRKTMLLLNKADLLTTDARCASPSVYNACADFTAVCVFLELISSISPISKTPWHYVEGKIKHA